MKQIFLLTIMLANLTVSAQSSVTIANSKVDNYGSKIVSFDLSWSSRTANHRDTVWVFVDYQPVNANGSKGSWTRAGLSAATVTNNGSSASYTPAYYFEPGNTSGVWVHGSKRQTNQQFRTRVTLKLNITDKQFSFCASATDYPPNLQFPSSTEINKVVLHGTPPFLLTDSGGSITTINTAPYTFYNTGNKFYTKITDETKCPGIVNCKASTAAILLCTGSAPALRILKNQ